MIAIGLVCLVLGLIFGISMLVTIGVVCLVVGVILFALASAGRPVGGRNWY